MFQFFYNLRNVLEYALFIFHKFLFVEVALELERGELKNRGFNVEPSAEAEAINEIRGKISIHFGVDLFVMSADRLTENKFSVIFYDVDEPIFLNSFHYRS